MPARVLFVDDEPNILRGLQRTFRRMRKEWDMSFVEGGEAAIKHVSDNRVDAIVTDMRMPGMDGAEFLNQASKLAPATIRIILSGEADQDMTFRTVGVSHQFLPKPCNTDSLSAKIQQSLIARGRLKNDVAHAAISGLASVPAADAAIAELNGLFDGPSPDIEDVARIFASDPGLGAKAMQLANSAYFGIGQSVSSPAEAVKLLGFEILRPLKDKGCFVSLSETVCSTPQLFNATLHDAAAVATLAEKIAAEAGASAQESQLAQVAGLLHNIGRLIICSRLPECYDRLDASTDSTALDQSEKKFFGATQADFGSYLALLWGLPERICSAITHQAAPSEADNSEDLVLLAVHAAKKIHLGQAAETAPSRVLETLDTACTAHAQLLAAATTAVSPAG